MKSKRLGCLFLHSYGPWSLPKQRTIKTKTYEVRKRFCRKCDKHQEKIIKSLSL